MITNVSAHTRTDTLLEVKNLNVDYFASSGTVHAVTDVSFTLRRGEILGLAGESGSGKSTLAYAITCLLRPPAVISGGEIIYYPRSSEDAKDNSRVTLTRLTKNVKPKNVRDGNRRSDSEAQSINLLQLSPAQLRDIRWDDLAIVFQSAMNALNPVMTVGAQIMDVLRTHRPHMGSMQREILTEIMRLREKLGFSVIFITHDLSLLLELADNVGIMYAGRIVEKASRRDLYLHPRHPYSYGLLNSFPSLHGQRRKMAGIPGSPPDLRAVPPGCAFHARCPLAFEPCRTVLPSLRSVQEENADQIVACHLYDLRYKAEPPSTADLARKYEALAEESSTQ